MRNEDFAKPLHGELVRSPQGPLAFVPAPMPPEIAWDADLVNALSRADARLSELSGIGSQLPNPHLLIAPYMRQEAVLSSRIEGTQTNLAGLFEDELRPAEVQTSVERSDAREVGNYVRALQFGIERLATLPLSLRLVRELHAHLMAGVRGGDRNPGEFRKHQNFIGARGSRIETATFVPPPPDRLQGCLDAWEKFIHERGNLPDLVQCAFMHAQFETIHPFADGNGRVGRLLITLFLIERGRLSAPLLYLSAYIEASRQDYYDLLLRARTHHDWRRWLMYFLAGVEVTARLAAEQAVALLALRVQYRTRFIGDGTVLALIEALFENPLTTARHAANAIGKSDPTARSAIRKLEDAGWLRESTGAKWGKVYVAQEILALLQKPDADLHGRHVE